MNMFLKRMLDVVSSALALLALSPLLLAVAIAVRADTPGPVFFRQKRLGKDGRVFEMYKFRSMVVDAERIGTGLFNYKNDPRVTKVGRFLRNTSLDEMPQLFNVLRGDMSLVGPRPAVTYELGDFDTLNARYKKRFTALPGITGLAQVMGRNAVEWDQKVNFDNEYINRFRREGVWLDVKILCKTVAQVFAQKDIYEHDAGEAADGAEAEVVARAREAEAEVIARAHAVEEPADFKL